MKYFKKEDDLKERYKELAKIHHPDRGGDVEVMKAINAEYDEILTKGFQAEGKSITEIEELLKADAIVRQKIIEILLLPDLIIELCGTWLWVTGNTKEYKEKLKEASFRWSATKQAWYWRAEVYRSYNRRTMGLEEIRYKHGSQLVNARERMSLTR